MDERLPTYLVSRSTSFSWLSVSVPLTDVGGNTTISPSWQGMIELDYFLEEPEYYCPSEALFKSTNFVW